MPRNPSELQRLEEELAHCKEQVKKAPTKAAKELMLRYVRIIEGQLGIQSKPYNSDDFIKG